MVNEINSIKFNLCQYSLVAGLLIAASVTSTQHANAQTIETSSIANASPENLNLAIAEVDALIDRFLKINQAVPFQLDLLKSLTQEYQTHVQRWGAIQQPIHISKLARLALGLGFAYQSKASDMSNASVIYGDAAQRWGKRNEPEIAQYMANLFLQYASLSSTLQADKALQIQDQAIAQYALIPDSRIQAGVVRLFDQKARLLIRLGQASEGLATFDKIQQTYKNPTDPNLINAIVGSTFAKGDILYSQLGKRDEAISLFTQSVKAWDSRTETDIQVVLAFMTSRLAAHESMKDDLPQATALYEDLLRRAVKYQVPSLKVTANGNIARLLYRQKKYEESIVACDKLISEYTSAANNNEQFWLASAMMIKGDSQNSLFRARDAVVTYDVMIKRFTTSTVPNIYLLVDEVEKSRTIAQKNALRFGR